MKSSNDEVIKIASELRTTFNLSQYAHSVARMILCIPFFPELAEFLCNLLKAAYKRPGLRTKRAITNKSFSAPGLKKALRYSNPLISKPSFTSCKAFLQGLCSITIGLQWCQQRVFDVCRHTVRTGGTKEAHSEATSSFPLVSQLVL